jgi:tetratricopeptide (TPR) repeat protein
MDYSSDFWNVLGHSFWKTGDLERARETFERGLSIDNENPALVTNYGNVCLSLFHKTKEPGSLGKAIELFKKAVELEPKNAQAYAGLGTAHLISRDLGAAMNDWKKVLEILPSHADSAYNLSRAYLTMGDKRKASDFIQKFMKAYSHLLAPADVKRFDELMQKCKR